MGGNLFKLGRLPSRDYLEIETELRRYLDDRFGGHYRIPRYYRSKPDFGDVDIILSDAAVTADWQTLKREIIRDLGIAEFASKTELLSTVYRNFQVDFFLVPAVELDSTWHFLSYNDLGNLLGKIYRRFNLKYGKDGLFFIFRRASGNYRRDILLSRDWREVLAFLELRYERWDEGFETLEDMFDWVISCRYFSAKPFLQRSAGTSARMEQRTTVRKFVEYIERKEIGKAFPFDADRTVYLPMISSFFAAINLNGEIKRERELEEIDRQVRAKFNGKLVMELFPELKGKRLGHFIRQFRSKYDDVDSVILNLSQEEIVEALRQSYAGFHDD